MTCSRSLPGRTSSPAGRELRRPRRAGRARRARARRPAPEPRRPDQRQHDRRPAPPRPGRLLVPAARRRRPARRRRRPAPAGWSARRAAWRGARRASPAAGARRPGGRPSGPAGSARFGAGARGLRRRGSSTCRGPDPVRPSASGTGSPPAGPDRCRPASSYSRRHQAAGRSAPAEPVDGVARAAAGRRPACAARAGVRGLAGSRVGSTSASTRTVLRGGALDDLGLDRAQRGRPLAGRRRPCLGSGTGARPATAAVSAARGRKAYRGQPLQDHGGAVRRPVRPCPAGRARGPSMPVPDRLASRRAAARRRGRALDQEVGERAGRGVAAGRCPAGRRRCSRRRAGRAARRWAWARAPRRRCAARRGRPRRPPARPR